MNIIDYSAPADDIHDLVEELATACVAGERDVYRFPTLTKFEGALYAPAMTRIMGVIRGSSVLTVGTTVVAVRALVVDYFDADGGGWMVELVAIASVYRDNKK